MLGKRINEISFSTHINTFKLTLIVEYLIHKKTNQGNNMSRIEPVSEGHAEPSAQPILNMIQKRFGRLPNMFQNMANSPATLQAFASLSECCEKTSLPPKLRHEIELVMAEANACTYCIAAHSQLAKAMRFTEQDILQARRGIANDPKSQAILSFCKAVVEKKGSVSDQEVQLLRDQGVSDKELCEILLVINFNMFTNYFNKIADTEVDFPLAPKI